MSQRPFDVGPVFTLAMDHYEAGRLGQAKDAARRIEKNQSRFPGLPYLLGLIALAEGHPRQAAQHLTKALAAASPGAPHTFPLLLAMARAQDAQNRLDQALTYYDRALNLAPGTFSAQSGRANILRRLGRDDEALAAYGDALAMRPDWAEGWNAQGNLLRASGHPGQAAQALARALELKPGWPSALNNLGVALKDMGMLDEGAAALAQAVAIRPDHAGSHANLAAILRLLGRYAEAVVEAEKALALAPKDYESWLTLGLARMALGDQAGAIEAIETSRTIAPHFAKSSFCMGEIYRESGDAAEAARHFRHYLSLDPDDIQGAALALAAMAATPPPETAPPAYIRSLFDQYAETFDTALVAKLSYDGPSQIACALSALAPSGGDLRDLDIMDLGCGTGLAGLALRPMARRLDGIDLSPRMIEKAAERQIYDSLAEGDIVALLAGSAAQFDLIVAADVFVYIGDLQPAFAAISQALRPGGLLAFTVEEWTGEPAETSFTCGKSHRFAHSQAYVQRLTMEFAMAPVVLRQSSMRREGGRPVPGLLAVLRKS